MLRWRWERALTATLALDCPPLRLPFVCLFGLLMLCTLICPIGRATIVSGLTVTLQVWVDHTGTGTDTAATVDVFGLLMPPPLLPFWHSSGCFLRRRRGKRTHER